MFLCDREIRVALARRAIVLEPSPPEGDPRWSPVSLDLTLDAGLDVWEPADPGEAPIDPGSPGFDVTSTVAALTRPADCTGGFVLAPHGFVLGWTAERLQLPPDAAVAAVVEGKSSLARIGLGVHITAPVIHPGFGTRRPLPIRLEIFNHNVRPVRLTAGLPVCQVLFLQVFGTPERGYTGQFSSQGPT